jgi:predicted enzyme related to lactoylglutathione lyase
MLGRQEASMIRGIHGLLYSTDDKATRAFFRDKVKLPGCDIGQGWWIFDFPEGDLGIHPAEDKSDAGTHNVSFYCDDIHGTVRGMKARGVVFTAPVADHGYGLVTYFEAPGGIKVQLYEPRYVKRKAARSGVKRSASKRSASKMRSKAPSRRKAKRTR